VVLEGKIVDGNGEKYYLVAIMHNHSEVRTVQSIGKVYCNTI